MEKLNQSGSVVLRDQFTDLDFMETLYSNIVSEFQSKSPSDFRSGGTKLAGPGYQWAKTIPEIDNFIIPRLAEHFSVPVEKFEIIDRWVLLQTTESWIDNKFHNHLGGGSGVVVAYIMTNPATDSISFADDGSNESKLSVVPGQILAFSSSVKHKPNPTTESLVFRISYNFTYNIKQDETEESKTRMEICNACDKLMQPVKICKECYCFMPAKTLIPISTCPIGKW